MLFIKIQGCFFLNHSIVLDGGVHVGIVLHVSQSIYCNYVEKLILRTLVILSNQASIQSFILHIYMRTKA